MKAKIFFPLFFIILISSCDNQENTNEYDIQQGKIVGYLKCHESNENSNTLFGFFIISTHNDSLLSFNILPSTFNLDKSNLQCGINFLNGDSISFSYRNAENDEIKYYDCPPTLFLNPTFYAIDDFSQVIITAISKI